MKLLRHLLLLLLTVAVLVSATGVTVGMHLCAGEINNFTLFGQAQPCPMEQKQEKLPPCHHGDAAPTEESADGCCENQTVTVDRVDVAVEGKTAASAKMQEVKLLAVVQVALAHLLAIDKTGNFSPLSYSSPLIVRNIPVLVQSFLL
jgi:hypothetical protein